MEAKCNVIARLKYSNSQVLHRSLVTNGKLYLFSLIESEKCDNCDKPEYEKNLD